ncbi:sugar phosphate isomerase/epimerase family protein [Sphaerimonospora cavernae]|uniref:Sugar phosphate isomerase/epimerase family protein n=1 Tax=Sphaerimonospora cavernae TaxID=1740611 RepID=A0ABV6UDF9_9ACTN
MKAQDDLVLCAGTVQGSGFRERVEAAAAAGFRGIGLQRRDCLRARAEGWTPAGMRTILDDHGLEIGELEAVTHWSAHHGEPEPHSAERAGTEALWELAADAGARAIVVVEMGRDKAPIEMLAEGFAALCDRAAGLGLLVCLEALPWSAIPDLATAAAITRLAGRPNGGVLFDTWHHFRAGGGLDTLVPEVTGSIIGIQVNDAPAVPRGDLLDEALHHRLLPGHGDARVADTLRALRAAGVDAPVGVEVWSDALAALPTTEAATLAARAAHTVIAAARR